jgi:microcystin-dependent protein
MSDPFLGQISVFGFNFAPYGWAQCASQLVPINQNTALYSLLGTYYGGNGTTTFALPNMQGNVAVSQGAAPGLQPDVMGETGGQTTVALTGSEGPMHGHSLMTNVVDSTSNTAASNVLAVPAGPGDPRPTQGKIYNPNPPNVVLTSVTGPAGNSQPHANVQPSIALNYCIGLSGIFPERG